MPYFTVALNTHRQKHLRLQGIAVVLAILVSLLSVYPVVAQNELSMSKIIVGNPTTVDVGQQIEYRIEYSCNSLTGPCGMLTVTDQLPPNVTYVRTDVAPGYTESYDPATRTVTITHPNFLDGTTSEATIVVQVDFDAPGGATLSNSATGSITNPVQTIITPPVDVTVNPPTVQWSVNKQRILPATIEPALDNDVTYEVQLCSDSATGNVSLQNAVLVDTFPPGAIVINDGGGTVVGNTITWNLGDLDIATIGAGCVSRFVVLRYPAGTFTETTLVTNSASATADDPVSGGTLNIGTGTSSHEFDPPNGVPSNGKSVSGSPVGLTGLGRFFLSLNTTNANVPVTDVIITDTMPPELEITVIQSGRWTPDTVQALVEYSRNGGASWTTLGTVDGTDDTVWTAPFTDITNVRWTFSYVDFVTGLPATGVPLGFTTSGGGNRPEIRFTPRAGVAVVGATYTNCAVTTWNAGTGTDTQCANAQIASTPNSVNSAPSKNRVGGSGQLNPGDSIQFDLRLRITERSSANLIDPTIVDALPDTLEFISWDNVTFSNIPAVEQVQPNLEVLNNFTIGATTYNTVLRWSWQNPAPAGSIDVNGNPGVANSWSLAPPALGNRDVVVTFTARVLPGTPAAIYGNTSIFLTDTPEHVCESGTPVADADDLDGDLDLGEIICQSTRNYEVREATVMVSQKWVANPPLPNVDPATVPPTVDPTCPDDGTGGGYTRFPCVAQGFPDNPGDDLDDFTYKMIMTNEGNVPASEYIMYDILPYVGDTGSGGPLSTTARDSEWSPIMLGPVVSADAFTAGLSLVIEYSNSSNPCRTEVFSDTGILEPAGCTNDWTASPADFSMVRAFRIRYTGGQLLNPLETMIFTVPMHIPSTPQSGEIAWNSFAQRLSNASTSERLPTAEPRKVGIIIPERLSIGNRVWRDEGIGTGNNGLMDGGELGIASVAVSLYLDSDGNGIPDGPAIATDVTDVNGFYLFSDLMPERYVVGIDNSNFNPGNPLQDLTSSNGVTGDNQTDLNDNGNDTPDATFGFLSNSIQLSINTEPTGESDLSGEPADGPFSRGNRGEADNNSDVTIDFGFYHPLSIGNRVWLDEGAGANRNNGFHDTDENGIAGITMSLYLDTDGNGVPDGPAIATDITDAGGYYLFDGLTEGMYLVGIDSGNFGTTQPLENHASSVGHVGDVQADLTDHGIDDPAFVTNGILSEPITLAISTEPVGEADLGTDPGDGPNSRGINGELDNDSDLTIDFGLYIPRMSLGNRVWFDVDNSGLIDAADGVTPGISGVVVSLYADADGNGIPDGGAIATDITDTDGYYLFDDLSPGNYVVGLDAANFNPGNSLQDLISSTGVTGDDQTDNNDNGIDAPNPPATGLLSNSINLTLQTEPTSESDLSNDASDGPAGERRGNQLQLDNDSDLTIDFGLYKPMSLGNRVWRDDGTGGGTANNGLQDGGEAGIPSVNVTLFADSDGNGIPDGPALATEVTDANGYYLFDGLIPGDYLVWIDDINFQAGGALLGLDSAPFSDASDTDRNDNGIDEELPAVNGVYSNTVNLSLDSEPIGETDLGPDNYGTNGETDNNSDLTIDFGFNVPPMSLGNRVWFDIDNSGLIDAADGPNPGIAGVTVHLYNDADQNGVPDGPAIASDVTNANGYYLFENLAPGSYVVGLDEVDFRTGGVVVDLFSSTGSDNTDTDSNDNGIDNVNPEIGGILSNTIVLSVNAEPMGEADLSDDAADGPIGESRGNNGELDSNSDLTVDFGLYKPMSLGNRVWFDINDSGTIDGSEGGIAGVTVNLYEDTDGNGTPDVLIATDVTDTNGYYLFDNLVPGQYFVEVPPTNFQAGNPLDGLVSSTGNDSSDTDSNDNGIDDAAPATNGIFSNPIVLTLDGEPLNEADVSGDTINDGPNSIGTNGETDENSDLTVDFGFVGAQMSLGNRVWLDVDDSGFIDAPDGANPGLANVAVSLYRDSDSNGVPDGPAIRTDVTDPNGYYLFDNLTPGDYVVGLDNSNFSAGNALDGLISSTGNDGSDTDSNDNGIDGLNATFGLLSNTVNLVRDGEPTGETDLSGDPGDGPNSRGNNGETDNNSDLTVDFGLYQPMSIGNRIWFDTDNNGQINASESGVAGVTVTLYDDTNGDGVPDNVIATDTTDAGGYYLFDGLASGDYIVVVDAGNFLPAGPLDGLSSSTGNATNNTDSNDNGIDDATPDVNGILSNPITLTPGGTPTGESDLSGNPADGPNSRGNNGETNNNSDLTVDFGFFGAQMSLGNRVWLDDGVGGGIRNNGLIDGSEAGIAGVRLNLYRDTDNDGVPDGAAIATDTTDANGYYLFEGLSPGRYIVGLNNVNFNGGQPLFGLTSSTGNDPSDIDSNDNGIDDPNLTVNGILSNTVELMLTGEPTGETDLSGNPADGPNSRGNNGETDNNSDLTVDFGLYKAMSLGNRIWFDTDDNGLIDAGEIGIAGINITLYADPDGNGVPDSVIATDVTDGGGYYLFDDLLPGNYIVGVDNANFQPAGPLAGFSSSTGDTADDTDSNDNGIDTLDPTYGIISSTVALTLDAAPTGETDTSGDIADGPNFRGLNGESDNNSDLTVDFGFFAGAMSIGNRVWLDDGAGGGTPNDGLINGGEVGIAGVDVNLYADANADGIPDGAAIATDTTNPDGYYLFDGIAPGNYLVQIAASNFTSGQPLFSLYSSTGDNATDIDSNDNGVDTTDPVGSGVFSRTVTLTADGEPTGEIDLSGDLADGPIGESRGNNGETDNNSDLMIDFGFAVAYDLGDAPNSYGTTTASNGPQHRIVSTIFLGAVIDEEADGQPSVGADGDDTNGNAPDDEDGVNIPVLVAGTTIDIEVTVFNNTGSDANFVGWIDFNGNGTFDSGEAITATVPSAPGTQIIQVPLTVPIDADVTTGGSTYARFRLTTDPIDATTPTGLVNDGEIEDYPVNISPPGLAITKTDGLNSIVVGQPTTYTITITNSGADVVNRNFVDNIPTGDPNGFDPTTITWTCTATNGASCVTGQPPGTGATGNGSINASIDVPRGGTVVYQITATLRPGYNNPTLVNTGELLPGGPVATDTNGVIFDPPSGTKVGVVRNGNIIRWTMVWLNTGSAQAATVTDNIQAGQTFDGNLTCTAFGTSSTTSCTITGQTVTWSGIIGTGNLNRVEISFDVSVSGSGRYRNSATIDVGGNTANASAAVRIGGSGSSDDSDDSTVVLVNPAIFKRVDPAFASPGDTVVWTIEVFNPNNSSVNNVSLSDQLPDELIIVSASSSSGNVSFTGQTVNVDIPVLNLNETVTVTIITQIADNTTAAIIRNIGILGSPFTGDTEASLVVVKTLPATGEAPWWRLPLMLGVLFAVSVLILVVARKVMKAHVRQ